MKIIVVQLYYLGVSTGPNDCLWVLATPCIFYRRRWKMFQGFDFICEYIYDLFILTTSYLKKYLDIM